MKNPDIKGMREKVGLLQRQVAEYCGISERTWRYYEKGRDIPHWVYLKFEELIGCVPRNRT
jgi:DNA-binding XRE family transcriptional regulator